MGVTCNRRLTDGRLIKHLYHAGQQVFLEGLAFPLTMGYYFFKGEDGRYHKRYVLSTRRLKASTLQWWGRRRWQIETFFKVIKHRFGLHRFGQCTKMGVYRWLLLVLLAFVLALWSHLARPTEQLNWAQAAELAVRLLMPQVVITSLLKELDRWRDEAHLLSIPIPAASG